MQLLVFFHASPAQVKCSVYSSLWLQRFLRNSIIQTESDAILELKITFQAMQLYEVLGCHINQFFSRISHFAPTPLFFPFFFFNRASSMCCILPTAAGRRDLRHRHGDSGPNTDRYLLRQHHCIVSYQSLLVIISAMMVLVTRHFQNVLIYETYYSEICM